MEITESVGKFLARCDAPDDEWLWCFYCERFFQARHLKVDFQSNREGCAFCNCAGFDVAIFAWDAFASNEDWPKSEAELHHGLCHRDAAL